MTVGLWGFAVCSQHNVDTSCGLAYVVVDVYFMLDAPHKHRLHLSSRSPSLGNCFYRKAAMPQEPEARYSNATKENLIACEVVKQNRG